MEARFVVRPSEEWPADSNGNVPWAVYDKKRGTEVFSGPDKSDADRSASTLNAKLS